MAKFNLSSHIDSNKIFLVDRSELSGRLDPFYYQPEIAELEKKIKRISNKKLRDYIIRISSGATPSVKAEEKYYSDKENGIPFLRVQNLQTNSELSLDDVKYINKETHEGLLKRSQVEENDLLVKITGVGRMAIASVAPKGFIGNTNQHMVVIKTTSEDVSRYLASFLNLDISEKLASRRATGGTRPALDYPALKSIPIVEGVDFKILEEAEQQKKELDARAKKLLGSIDDYLLGELGIKYKQYKANKYGIFSLNTENHELFSFFTEKAQLKKRYDVQYYLPVYSKIAEELKKSKYDLIKIKDVAISIQSGKAPKTFYEEGINYLKVRNIKDCEIDWDTDKINENDLDLQYVINIGDILFVTMGAGSLGKATIYEDNILCQYDPKITRFKLDKAQINNYYFLYLVRSNIYQKLFEKEIRGSTGMTMLNPNDIANIFIPLPPLKKQNEIANHIQSIRQKAKDLQTEGSKILEDAKHRIEQMILKP